MNVRWTVSGGHQGVRVSVREERRESEREVSAELPEVPDADLQTLSGRWLFDEL